MHDRGALPSPSSRYLGTYDKSDTFLAAIFAESASTTLPVGTSAGTLQFCRASAVRRPGRAGLAESVSAFTSAALRDNPVGACATDGETYDRTWLPLYSRHGPVRSKMYYRTTTSNGRSMEPETLIAHQP